MQIFLESAHLDEIKSAFELGQADGLMTTPNLVAGHNTSYEQLIPDLLPIVDGSIFLDVEATSYQEIINQAQQLNAIDRRVVVKAPCTLDGLHAAKDLTLQGIGVCVTYVFDLAQAVMAGKIGVAYIHCPLDQLESGVRGQGEELLAEVRTSYDEYGFSTQIIAGGIKEVTHFEEAATIGINAASVKSHVLEKLSKHRATDQSLQKAIDDWQRTGMQLPK